MSATIDQVFKASQRLAGDMSGFDTELDVAKAIRDGELSSPQNFANMMLIALRITGTGVAYRQGIDEFCFRDPSIYLTAEFLERCQGLPVIVEHPKGSLNSEEFHDRIVGMVTLPYLKDQEVWGIAKIYDAATREMLETEQLSTSPCVVFRSPSTDNSKIDVNGATVLIEGTPQLICHVALCAAGVWDKGGKPAGVDSSNLTVGDSILMGTSTADLLRQVAELQRRIGPEMCHEMRSEFVAAQSRADSAYRAIGDAAGAPPFMNSERLHGYRCRLLKPLQPRSTKFKDSDLTKIHDPSAFDAIEAQVYADAAGASMRNEGPLHAVTTLDAAGRPITKYFGSAGSCWDRFNPPIKYIRRFNTSGRA
jgi:hypothetical protein